MPEPYIANTHVLVSEYACHHCHKLPPRLLDEDGEMLLEYQVLFHGFEAIRLQRGGTSLGISSGYRCLVHEKADYDTWLLAGKPGGVHGFMSAHVFGLALDLDPVSWEDQAKIVAIARSLTPKPRIGWKQYKQVGQMLVHIDYAQLIQPCPTLDYSAGVEW